MRKDRIVRTTILWRHLNPGESFSSLYARVCRASAVSLHELGTLLLSRFVHSDTTRDFDVMDDSALMRTFAENTHHRLSEIRCATLGPLAPRLSAQEWRGGIPPRWALHRLHRADQRRHGCWVQVCPQCLQEDREPYIRLLWRLAFLTDCPRHGVQLIDRCPDCSNTLDYLSGSQGVQRADRWLPLSVCTHCDADWRNAEGVAADAAHLAWQRQAIQGVFEGWVRIGGEQVMSPLYLDGVFDLQRALRFRDEGGALFKGVVSRLELDVPLPDGKIPIDMMPVETRRTLLQCVAHLLEGWPSRLVEDGRRFGFRWNSLGELSGVRPFWLEKVGRRWLDRSWYRPSDQEAGAVKSFLKTRGLDAPQVTVREWLGARVSKPMLGVRPVSTDAPWQGQLCGIGLPSTEEQIRWSFIRRIARILRRHCSRGLNRPPGRRPMQFTFGF